MNIGDSHFFSKPKEYLKKNGCHLFLIFLSAFLFSLSFPKTDYYLLSFVAFLPLFLVFDKQAPAKSFRSGYLFGFLYFLFIFWWIGYVTTWGTFFLILYISLYYGILGPLYHRFRHQPPLKRWVFLAAAFTALEWTRNVLFSGFGWGALGYSQYKNLPFIQVASVTGLFGLSFLILLINGAVYEIFQAFRHQSDRRGRTLFLAVVIVLVGLVYGYGVWSLRTEPRNGTEVRIAVIQSNVDQDAKWEEENWPEFTRRLFRLTEEAAGLKPDLIIWPESSFPGYLWEEPERLRALSALVDGLDIPLLLGAVDEEGEDYYNSALLMNADGKFSQKYNKIHLVPFGEYMPFRKHLPFLEPYIPFLDFSAGDEYTVFSKFVLKEGVPAPFSVLICFEDTVPQLVRRFVDAGAQLLVNLTNDAWFYDSKEPYMHLQSSVFRAVENRRVMVRAANTGVSGFIDTRGRLVSRVHDARGKETFVQGVAVAEVRLNRRKSLYTLFGDWFVYLCMGMTVYGFWASRKEFGKS